MVNREQEKEDLRAHRQLLARQHKEEADAEATSRLHTEHPELVQLWMEFDHTKKKKRAAEMRVGFSAVNIVLESSSSLDSDF
jgi:hypothetical protein